MGEDTVQGWQKTFVYHHYDWNPVSMTGFGIVRAGSPATPEFAYGMLKRAIKGCPLSAHGQQYACWPISDLWRASDGHLFIRDAEADSVLHNNIPSPFIIDWWYELQSGRHQAAKFYFLTWNPPSISGIHQLVRCQKGGDFSNTFTSQYWNCEGRFGYSARREIGRASCRERV